MNSIGENKKVTRARVSLKEKWEAVKRMEKGDNSLAIAKELGVSQRVIYQWMSVKEKIKKWYKTNPEHAIGLNRKNLIQVHSQQLDQVVYLWYVKCVKQGISVTGPMIRHKAMELNEQLRAGWPFQASDGWLHKWKKRHGIIINPEQRFADDEPHQLFDDKFKTFIEQENLVADQEC
ncbi:jerky protein homolog isoform X2 [Leptopilina boulardi]|uniref:jerky protein homolog isoform X2 n=1 Tax=Leptopilina boulardi TaxID=63433 RepID=UPI0021F57256|nr:jerky protein homolog isoform X2 [Leptopilina boulardi]